MLLTMTRGRNSRPSHPVIRELQGPTSIELLKKIFLHETTEVTFMAIDFEYRSKHDDLITEIGISTLSTDEWRQFPRTLKKSIHSRRHIIPQISAGRNFLFGESEHIVRKDIPQFLKDSISMRSPAGARCKVVLVGHHISAELDIMDKLGINLRDQELFSIEGILNISTIAEGLGLPFSMPPSLERMLGFLGIPFQKSCLHNAGNDAHFTLRALLMLTAIALERMEPEGFLRAAISDLKSIALDPIDFDSPTPDADKSLKYKNAKKEEWSGYKREPTIKLTDDWWSEEEPLGSTLFGMDADT